MIEIKTDEKAVRNMDKRVSWLDRAKGFGILFIVLGHASYGYLNWFCFSFNSVIFFILAGMAFCRTKDKRDELLDFDNRKTSDFLRKTGKRLLFPYFVWGSISIAIYYLLEGVILSHLQVNKNQHFALIPNFIGLIYANSETGFFEYYRPLWFLPCLVAVEIIWFLILKFMYRMSAKRMWIYYGMFMLLFLLFGILESCFKWELILPFEIESAIFMSFFFGIGLMLRSRGGGVKQVYIKKELYILFTFIWLTISLSGIYINGGTDTRSDNFGNIGLFIFNALWMSLGIIYIAFMINRFRVMEYLGKRTLAILVIHKYPIMVFKLAPFIQTKLQEGNLVIEVFVTIVTIVCCLMVEKIIVRLMPQLFGKFALPD